MRLLRLLSLVLLLGSSLLSAQSPWLEVHSDLPQDPNISRGTLSNGLLYLIEPTAEPPGAVSFRMIVGAGSRNETPLEEGVAHLVEHMVFRKSKDPAMEGVRKELERKGVALGPNLTAFTFYDHTVYQVDLPGNSPELRSLALRLLRGYADAAAFAPAEVELEKEVVLNEDTLHKNQGSIVQTELNRIVWPSELALARTVGGSDKAIRSLTELDCSRFYKSWYRPENTALIVTGSVDPTALAGEIEKAFSSFAPQSMAPDMPAQKTTKPSEFTSRYLLLSIGNPNDIFLRYFRAWETSEPAKWDRERRAQALRRQLALGMFNERLYRKSRRAGAALDRPMVEVVSPLPGVNAVLFSGRANPTDWPSAFETASVEFRKALTYGFNDDELLRAKKALERSYKLSISYAPSARAENEANRIKEAFVGGFELLTPQCAWDAVKPDLEKVTAKECADAFRDLWGTEPPRAIVAVSAALNLEAEHLLQELQKAEFAKIAPEPQTEPFAFAYDSFGPQGEIAKETAVEDLEIRSVRFKNGVGMSFKKTDFERDVCEVYVRFGSGRNSQPNNRASLDRVASIALWEGGLGKHPAADLARFMDSELFTVNFSVEDDAFCFWARGASESMRPALRLITAFLKDAAFRPSAMTSVRAVLDSQYLALQQNTFGPLTSKMERILASDDARFGAGELDDAKSRTMNEVEQWLKPELAEGAIEVGIAGDLSYEEARSIVSETLGALPPRAPRTRPERLPSIKRALPAEHLLVSAPGLTQSALSLVWMLPEPTDIRNERRYTLISELLGNRVREWIRERKGATYWSDAGVVAHEGFSNFAYLQLFVQVDTPRIKEVVDELESMVFELQSKGVTDDEFERVRQPFISSYEKSRRSNAYWGYWVLRTALENPRSLDAARDRSLDIRKITRAEIEKIIRANLSSTRRFLFVTMPTPADPLRQPPKETAGTGLTTAP